MKALKIIGFSLLSIILAAYLSFLFVLPNVINFNKYGKDISKIVKDTTKLDLSIKNIKIKTSWNLETKLLLSNVEIKYPNKNKLLSAKSCEAGIKLFPLVFLKIELSPIKLQNPNLSINIMKDGRYDLEKFISEMLAETKPAQNDETASKNEPILKLSENLPDIILNNYNISLNDSKTSDSLKIAGKSLKIYDFKLNKKIKLSTTGELFVNDKKYLTYNAKIDSFLPKAENTETSAQIEIPQITYNPIPVIKKYNLCANLDTDLKITQNNEAVLLKGHLNTTDINFKIQNTNLDKSFLKLAFNGDKIDIDSNVFVAKDQKFTVKGLFQTGKKQYVDLKILSDKTDLANIQHFLTAILDTAGIKTDIESLKVLGQLNSNFNIKSDMKTVQSSGILKITNASISHANIPLSIKAIQSDLDFNNNKITIKNTSALVNNSLFKASGTIDERANANIKITADKLPLNLLYEAFAPIETKKTLKINNGTLSIDTTLKGQLAKIEPIIKLDINNLKIYESNLKANTAINNILVDLKANIKGEYNGTAKAAGANLSLNEPKTRISMSAGELDFNTKDITLKPSTLLLDNSSFTISGDVKDYAKKLNAVINVNGKFTANDAIKYIPKEYRTYIKAKGAIPVIATISSNGKDTKILAQTYATPQNYLSVLDIKSIIGKPSIINFDLDTDGNNLKINDIAMYGLNNYINFNTNYKANIANGFKTVIVSGKIGNLSSKAQTLQNIKISTPTAISASIPNLKNSSINAKADITINGTTTNPLIKGSISIPALSIPEYKVSAQNTNADFTKDTIYVKSQSINLNGSQITLDTEISTNFGKYTTIKNINISSNYADVDKMFEIMELMPQSNVAPGASVPVIIQKGRGTIAKAKSGNLVITNASGDFTLKNNIFKLTNIKADAYSGVIAGNVDYNVPYETAKAKIQGRNINSTPALEAVSGLKDQIQGSLDFDADISMIGATYEQQMKTLNGTFNFSIGNGQMGSLGKLEHFIYASNLISQKFTQSNINSVVQTLAPKNTGKFNYLKGHLTFASGWATLNPIHSGGPQMSLYITGKYNLLNNYASLEILGRIAKEIASVMGSVGDISVSKLLGNIPKLGSTATTMLNNYNAIKDSQTIQKIPQLVPESTDTKQFQVIINGNIEKATAVRSFKWVASEAEINQAKSQINSQIQSLIPEKIQNIIKPTTENTRSTPAAQPTTKQEVLKNTGKMLQDVTKNALPNFWNNIE